MITYAPASHRLVAGLLFAAFMAAVPSGQGSEVVDDKYRIEVWHTFVVNGRDEQIFLAAIDAFEAENPDIEVKATRIPFEQNLQQFINSSQGGEAPDLIRFSGTELSRIGHITVEGLPLLEDLRPHLTPNIRTRFEPRALEAMRYGKPLYAIPVSQDSLTLIYNRSLFDAAGISYPSDDWTTSDLLSAAAALTDGDVMGLTMPLMRSYWFVPFQTGFGGALFDADGELAFDSEETATAVEWFLDLERTHHVVAPGTKIESMSTQFTTSKAAMILDGSWNINMYLDASIDLGQAVMPIVEESGKRMGPLLAYFGWAVSKQSDSKVGSVKLALWLSSADVQKEFALSTYMVPTDRALASDEDIVRNPILAGFLKQTRHGTRVPASRATQLIFEQLDTALEMTYTGAMDTRTALEAAKNELEKVTRR